MIGRILVIVVALQLVMTGAFAYTTMAIDHCPSPVSGHVHLVKSPEHSQPSAKLSDRDKSQTPMSPVNCANPSCTDHFGWFRLTAASMDTRSDQVNPVEPRMALQSVIIAYLRPPLG